MSVPSQSQEQKVWKCIHDYRKTSAKSIEKAYFNNMTLILNALKTYANLGVYHCHGSGKPGDPENHASAAMLDLAIEHLNTNAPPEPLNTKKTPNNQIKKGNEKRDERLIKIISDNEGCSVPQMIFKLQDENNVDEQKKGDLKWHTYSRVWDKYFHWYKERPSNKTHKEPTRPT